MLNGYQVSVPLVSAPRGFPAPRRTVVILDFDDTLFPSTALAAWPSAAPAFGREILPLQKALVRFLRLLLQDPRRKVLLVSNGSALWFRSAMCLHLPKVWAIMRDHRVPMLSARDTAPAPVADLPGFWKASLLFKLFLEPEYQDSLNIISLSDALDDRHLILTQAPLLPTGSVCKSIKFCDAPSIECLAAQIGVVTRAFMEIESSWASLDLFTSCVEKEAVEPSAC